MGIIPKSRPQFTLHQVRDLADRAGVADQFCIVGVRGYYKNTMGEKNKNDRAIYDDAIFILGHNCFKAFNANVDPGAFRKHIANLKAGVWNYKLGMHGKNKPKFLQYEALVQAGPVTVVRDQEGNDHGYFGINIHRGGFLRVSSIGCQTIWPMQWSEFIETVKQQTVINNQKIIKYILIEA